MRSARLSIRRPGGGFEIHVTGDCPVRAIPARGRWRIEGPNVPVGWWLSRDAAGFALHTGAGESEVTRSFAWPGVGPPREGVHLLAADGRLFRVVLRGPREAGFELRGWETPGAYLIVRPHAEGWSLEPTAAGSSLEDDVAVAVLLAAEVLDCEAALTGDAGA